MSKSDRILFAAKFAGLHAFCTLFIALAVAAAIFYFWYPYPYGELSGGRDLFAMIFVVDVICGPLLTFILVSPKKAKREIFGDMCLVVLIQFSALAYGTWTAWQARPSYLVLEVDRFKVVSLSALDPLAIKALPSDLSPSIFGGVKVVALRPPLSVEEKNKVLFESFELGRDYSVRPEFYVPYQGAAAIKSLERAVSLEKFLNSYPTQRAEAERVAGKFGENIVNLKYIPVVGRSDWVALLRSDGSILGFLEGDGFF
jgi:hypothetical protein